MALWPHDTIALDVTLVTMACQHNGTSNYVHAAILRRDWSRSTITTITFWIKSYMTFTWHAFWLSIFDKVVAYLTILLLFTSCAKMQCRSLLHSLSWPTSVILALLFTSCAKCNAEAYCIHWVDQPVLFWQSFTTRVR